jgi:hypothetical protein
MELSDVEFHLRHLVQLEGQVVEVHADIFQPAGSEQTHLSAFFQGQQGPDAGDNTVMAQSDITALASLFTSVKERMLSLVPVYMVPTLFIPISKFPTTLAGKLDRNALKAWASSLSALDLARFIGDSKPYTAPETDLQKEVCRLYGPVFLGWRKVALG